MKSPDDYGGYSELAGGSGYREHEHTADWELEVWAPSLEELFEQAARGMFAMCGARLLPESRKERSLSLEAADSESLLVAFLQELLFLSEVEGLGFDSYRLEIDGRHLECKVGGAPLAGLDKEIKAVTYHKLKIEKTAEGFQVRIVFDV